MSNQLYNKGKEAILGGTLNLATASIKAMLVNTTTGDGAGFFYTFSQAHDFLDDIPSGARMGTAVALTSKTFTNGVFDAADIVFSAVAANVGGQSADAIVLYNDSPSTEATKNLIGYFDTVSGLPIVANGGNINIAWDATGIIILA